MRDKNEGNKTEGRRDDTCDLRRLVHKFAAGKTSYDRKLGSKSDEEYLVIRHLII